MTAPRQVLPGTTYLVTRRCTQRQFLLSPSPTTNEVFLYLLAVAARRFGMHIHAFCVMSNHYHLVLTDPSARLPAFHQFLDALVARALNASLGRWESFWDPNSYSAVVLAAPTDIVEKAAYVLTNPVAAGLVESGEAWRGLRSAPERIGGAAVEAPRPRCFFAQNGSMPASASLELTVPPGFDSAAQFQTALASAVEAQEARARLARPARPVTVVDSADRTALHATSEERRRGLRPRIAARDPATRIALLARLKAFLHAYRTAWRRRRRGEAGVVFPAGTYLLRILHGAPCSAVA